MAGRPKKKAPAASRNRSRKDQLVDAVVKKARQQIGKSKADSAEILIRAFFQHVPQRDLDGVSERDALGWVMSSWKNLQSRKPGTSFVRVINPSETNEGWTCGHSVIEIVNDDMPFLVDSVTSELNRSRLTAHLIVHPIVKVKRTAAGKLARILPADHDDPDAVVESVMHIQINEQTRPESRNRIEQTIRRVLGDVRAAVEDWRSMRVRLADVVAELDSAPPPLEKPILKESKDFLRWLDDNNFTYLGYRELDLKRTKSKTRLETVKGSGLGVLRGNRIKLIEGFDDNDAIGSEALDHMSHPTVLMISKSNGRSTVHRSVHLDVVAIKRHDNRGRLLGFRVFVGLFTSTVYNQRVDEIPIVRRKANAVIERAGFPPGSHDDKALKQILETLPRDDMFQITPSSLYGMSLGILTLLDRPRIALFVRRDPFRRFISCIIMMPRERYTTALRERMQSIIEKGFGGKVSVYYAQVTDQPLSRLQFFVRLDASQKQALSEDEIESQLIEAGRDWSDDLLRALTERHGEAEAFDLHAIYRNAFPVAYRDRYSAAAAVYDIDNIVAALNNGDIAVDLYRELGMEESAVRLKVYHRGGPVPLSDVLPMLENVGFRVMNEVPARLTPDIADGETYLHDFGLERRSGRAIQLSEIKEKFEELFIRIWRGGVENDGFNRLVFSAGLDWREIVILRAYSRYLRQTAIPFSQAYMEETLARNPEITRKLVELFQWQFDPVRSSKRNAHVITLKEEIEEKLDAVANLDEDRILRRFANAIQASLRTNYYQMAEDGEPKSYLSIKLDSGAIDDLPLPKPWREIFVYSARVEGVHLRGGRVARGGLRWSDRREDFRTEILGLMKAQMTKNAVIVPVGAKGGFVLKQAPPPSEGREAFQNEGIECYKIFIRGLLDITDNLEPGKLIPPTDVIRRDDDDPYLVVAADKGTATFSDIANGVSREYGFWMDDAFASGGSAGYDHKKMGITARGAWESVMRHFREIGVDCQTEEFTCVGVGDMSGDVFGNGMLLSKHTKLLGAFNHLHIFVDPDPDPAATFRERKRLFDKGRSSWTDYNTDLISKGGGIFDRTAKSIRITPQMREAFDLPKRDTMTPNELIRGMLAAPADLLWFGGIGTYVKAKSESDADAGDRANDPLRLNGGELRCKIIGEGANLGTTQLGRIEFALNGGRINTDFIDNSAGVASSDQEVNIKILFGEVIAKGKMDLKARDKMLVSMTNDVAAHVLMDNYRQSMALTHVEAQGVAVTDEAINFMRALEKSGELDRDVEFLPDDEQIRERALDGAGLTRPELSVLLAYAKLALYEDVLNSDVPDDPTLIADVGLYFPTAMRKKLGSFIPGHRLRREITATYVTNSLVNRAGPFFVNDLVERLGVPVADIVKAYLIVRGIYGLRGPWAEIEALDNKVSADVQTEMNLDILRLIRRATEWMLRHGPAPLNVAKTIEKYTASIGELSKGLGGYMTADMQSRLKQTADRYVAAGVPAALAKRISELDALFSGCDIVRIADESGHAVSDVAKVYFAIGQRFGLNWLRNAADELPRETEWQDLATAALVDDLYAEQSALAKRLVSDAGKVNGSVAPDAVIDAWASTNGRGIDRIDHLVQELRSAGAIDLAMLSVANREIRGLLSH